MATPIKIPKTVAELMDPRTQAELVRLQNIVNAIQNLRGEIRNDVGTVIYQAVIQINGDSAVIKFSPPAR